MFISKNGELLTCLLNYHLRMYMYEKNNEHKHTIKITGSLR